MNSRIIAGSLHEKAARDIYFSQLLTTVFQRIIYGPYMHVDLFT